MYNLLLLRKTQVDFGQNLKMLFFFPVPVCTIRASGVPGGTLVSMNRFSTLCG
jgi:hypothetical protein